MSKAEQKTIANDVVVSNVFTANSCKDRLDYLMWAMNELQLNNLIEILNVYITLLSLWVIESRMVSESNENFTHETEMRWLGKFQNFVAKYLK